jgi:hypothetical protein
VPLAKLTAMDSVGLCPGGVLSLRTARTDRAVLLMPATTSGPELPRDKQVQILVRGLDGRTLSLQLPASAGVAALHAAVEERTGVPVREQRLIFSGKPLCDDQTLSAAGVCDGSEVRLLLALKGGAHATPCQQEKKATEEGTVGTASAVDLPAVQVSSAGARASKLKKKSVTAPTVGCGRNMGTSVEQPSSNLTPNEGSAPVMERANGGPCTGEAAGGADERAGGGWRARGRGVLKRPGGGAAGREESSARQGSSSRGSSPGLSARPTGCRPGSCGDPHQGTSSGGVGEASSELPKLAGLAAADGGGGEGEAGGDPPGSTAGDRRPKAAEVVRAKEQSLLWD